MINKCDTRYCSVCYGNSRPEVFCKKGVLRYFAKFTGKHLTHMTCNFIKKRLWHRCFPVSFANFPRAPFLTEHLRWMVLLLDEIQNTKNIKTQEPKERKFEKK